MAVTAFQSEILRLIARSRKKWHDMIWRARETVAKLPSEHVGKAVMTAAGELFNGTDDELVAALKAGSLTFHEGHIGGAWPRIIR